MTPCPHTCKYNCEYEDNEMAPVVCSYQPKFKPRPYQEHTRTFKVVGGLHSFTPSREAAPLEPGDLRRAFK